jgi:hypothetical protein
MNDEIERGKPMVRTNSPRFCRDRDGGMVAHKGSYARHGRHFIMQAELEEWIVEHVCGFCLVSLYTMSLAELTTHYLDWKAKQTEEVGVSSLCCSATGNSL